MNMSFYTAALGAAGQQEKMNVIANNIANVNTDGFRSKNAVFSDLMYYNMRDEQGADTRVKAGSGIALGRTDTDFSESSMAPTGGNTDFAIRKGLFHASGSEYTGCFLFKKREIQYVSESGRILSC